jgi:hypothetical protein
MAALDFSKSRKAALRDAKRKRPLVIVWTDGDRPLGTPPGGPYLKLR